jgi:two-component system, cell cycle response regulator DivK
MSKGTILIIEDNVDNLDLVRFLLEDAGYSVLRLQPMGVLAWKWPLQQRPCLVLLDLSIPEIDGWNLAEMFKSNEAGYQAYPAGGIDSPRTAWRPQKALDAGCDGYISKPLDIANFVQMIEEHLTPVNK